MPSTAKKVVNPGTDSCPRDENDDVIVQMDECNSYITVYPGEVLTHSLQKVCYAIGQERSLEYTSMRACFSRHRTQFRRHGVWVSCIWRDQRRDRNDEFLHHRS
ncbi:unnamed protein product [Clavelina lepadiformis]|uniref:Uncharacterized protein n=1 Tax=Clavelina lepadiformis TaxID=159417 RepID=A0ABP0FE30_CLALP